MNRPDFVIVGGYYDNKVLLLASKRLHYAELEQEPAHDYWPLSNPPLKLTCSLAESLAVTGNTYPEAWQTLFEEWAPGSTGMHSIGQQPAIRTAGEPECR